MNDELDTRIRAMLSAAVQDAPPAPALPRSPAARPQRVHGPRRSLLWVGAALAAAAAAITAVVLVRDSDPRVRPADGTTTTTGSPAATRAWPADLTVVVASGGGMDLVSPSETGYTTTHIESGLQGDVAFQLPGGTIVSDEGLLDVGADGTALYSGEWAGFRAVYEYPLGGARPAEPLMFPVEGEPTRLTYSADQLVGEGTLFAGGRTPLRLTQDGQYDISTFLGAGVRPPLDDADDAPRLFSVSASGRTVAWVEGNGLVVSDGTEPRTVPIPDGARVVELDLADDYAAITRADAPGTILDLRTGASFPVPMAGRVTISLADPGDTTVPPTAPSGSTTTTSPDVDVPPLEDGFPTLVAGAGGVHFVTAAVDLVWTTAPMAAAVQAPDGSVIAQRATGVGGPGLHEMGDTVPLRIAAYGAEPVNLFDQLIPAGDVVAGWYTIHDATTVGGRPLLLLERQHDQSAGLESAQGELFTLDLETGEMVTVLEDFGGWESGSSRLHLSETGLVVGERFDEVVRSFFAVALDGGWAPTAADLGVAASYGDCTDCPRAFTITRDGSRLAWLDGTSLHVVPTTGGDMHLTIDLGEAGVGVADLDLHGGYVVLTYGFAWQPEVPPAVVIILTTGEEYELPGTAAVAVA